jgi:hypothetical protein
MCCCVFLNRAAALCVFSLALGFVGWIGDEDPGDKLKNSGLEAVLRGSGGYVEPDPPVVVGESMGRASGLGNCQK